MEPEVQAGGIKDDGVDNTKREGRDTIAIDVLWAPIVAFRVEVAHVGSAVECCGGCL